MRRITFGNTYKIIESITPVFVLSILKKTVFYKKMSRATKKYLSDHYTPSWQTIVSGPLRGCELYIDPSGEWQKQMLDGTYDVFFFDFLDKIDLSGKTALDIGAHIGFHTLHFARKVGPNGSVVSFEPNPINIDRLKMIVDRNKELNNRIKVVNKAVSDRKGLVSFTCSGNVDDGTSCGGFIDRSDTVYEKSSYEEKRGFHPITVEAISLDEMVESGMLKKPDLMKIDIEGAEYLAVKGSMNTLKKYMPILLIEIHSKLNSDIIYPLLKEIGYDITILKKEDGDRCFIAGLPKKIISER